MARRTLTTNDVVEILDAIDEPVMHGSDDEDILCEEGM